MHRRHFIASAAALAAIPIIPSIAANETDLDRVIRKLGEIGHVHYRGQEWLHMKGVMTNGTESAHLFIVTEKPFEKSFYKTGNYAMVVWYDGEVLDYEEVRRAFVTESYSVGVRVGSGPYGGYDMLGAPLHG